MTQTGTSEPYPGYDEFCRAFDLEEQGRFEEAIRMYRRAAKKGLRSVYLNIADIYDEMDPPQPREAVRWYKRAVACKDANAAWNLAVHYRLRENKPWYLYWLRRAVAMGNHDAKSLFRRRSVEQILAALDRRPE